MAFYVIISSSFLSFHSSVLWHMSWTRKNTSYFNTISSNTSDVCVVRNYELNIFDLMITSSPSTFKSLLIQLFSTVSYLLQQSLPILLTNLNYQHMPYIYPHCHSFFVKCQFQLKYSTDLTDGFACKWFSLPLVHKIFSN